MRERDESLGSGGLGQHANAAADLQTRAGHLLPRTQRYSDAHDCRWEGGDTELYGNMREEQVTTTTLPARVSRQPSTQKLGEREDRPNSWAERAREGGWDSCTRTPKAVILLTVPTGPIKGENGGAVSAGEGRYLQDGGPREG